MDLPETLNLYSELKQVLRYTHFRVISSLHLNFKNYERFLIFEKNFRKTSNSREETKQTPPHIERQTVNQRTVNPSNCFRSTFMKRTNIEDFKVLH